MRRWHEERDLMLRRWRSEIAAHGGHPGWRCGEHSFRLGWRGVPIKSWYGSPHYAAPLPPVDVCESDCHCFRGAGYFRKRRPIEKYHWRDQHPSRMETKRREIRYSLDGYDGLLL